MQSFEPHSPEGPPPEEDKRTSSAYNRTARVTPSSETALLRAWNNAAKNYLLQYTVDLIAPQPDSCLRVVEMACGRGGEMHKWMQIAERKQIVIDWRGIDVSSTSIEVLQERFSAQRSMRMVGDDSLPRFQVASVSEILSDQVRNNLIPDDLADIVSMQMAFHYMWSSIRALHTWFTNVSSMLRVGGVVCVTYFDAQAALRQKELSPDSTLSFLKGAVTVSFPDAERARREAFIPYTFYMDSSVDGAVEYTVRVRDLIVIARVFGFEVLRAVRLVDLPIRHEKMEPSAASTVLRGALRGASVQGRDMSVHDVGAIADFARFYRGLVIVKTR